MGEAGGRRVNLRRREKSGKEGNKARLKRRGTRKK